MPFVTISPSQTDKNSPVDDDLMDTIREDLDYLNTQIGGGGGSGAAGIEAVSEKSDQEHFYVKTQRFSKSLHESFRYQKPKIEGLLCEDAAATATSLKLLWNVLFPEPGNPDFDGATGWTAITGTDASGITTSATKIAGSNALSWDKAGGTSTLSGVQKDLGAGNTVSVGDNLSFRVWKRPSSITSFSSFKVRFSADANVETNYREFTVSVDYSGASISGVQYWWLDFDLTGGTAVGTGWDYTQPIRSYGFLYETVSAAQTLTILADLPVFNFTRYKEVAQKGREYTIYDTSLQEDVVIDMAATDVVGNVLLKTALVNSYSAGSPTKIMRTTAEVTGNTVGSFVEGLSGTINTKQTVRVARELPVALSAATVSASIAEGTVLFFEVNNVVSSTSFVCSDPSNMGFDQLKSGDSVWVFEVKDVDGRKDYRLRTEVGTSGKLTLSANTSYSAPDLTFTNGGSNAGIDETDIVIKDDFNVYVSVQAATDEEDFGTVLTPTDIIVNDLGLPIIQPDKLFALYDLGLPNPERNRYGFGADLTVNGSIPVGGDWRYGRKSRGPFTASNFFNLTNGQSTAMKSDVLGLNVCVFMWVKVNTSTTSPIIGHANGPGGQGWAISYESSLARFGVATNGTFNYTHTGTVSLGTYYLVAINLGGPTSTSTIWVNKTPQTFTQGATDNSNSQIRIGFMDSAAFSVGEVAYAGLYADYQFTQSDIDTIYQNGFGSVFGANPTIDLRYSKAAQTGTRMSAKLVMNRRTDDIRTVSSRIALIG